MLRPFTIKSLWDVLQIDALNMVNTFSYLGAALKHLEICRAEMLADGDIKVAHMSAEQLGGLMKCSQVLGQLAEKLGMISSKASAQRFWDYAEGIAKKAGQMSSHEMGQITTLGSHMLVSFGDEIEARLLFVLPPQHASLYSAESPFGEPVDAAFPSATQEISDAAKCRALGQWTACVVHLMRALEPGINALARSVDVTPDQNWNTALNQIDAKLREVSKSRDGAEAEQWASETSAHFRSIKNAWRNHAAHGRARYNEEEAVAIFDNVGFLMRTLAGRLAE